MERSEIRDQPHNPPSNRSLDAPTRISLRSIRATRVASDDSPLLTRPHDARDPETIFRSQQAVGLGGIERLELDRLGGLALELAGQNLARAGLDQDPVAAADRGVRRYDEDRRVAIDRPQRVAGNLQRVGV